MEPTSIDTLPFVTIIIPTFRDWERMALCLKALARQTYAPDRFEIIVANNDPSDPPPADFRFPGNAISIDVAKPGSYAARNRALNIAKGTIIGFTDADCIPAPDWIANAVTYLQKHPQVCRVAGQIKIFYQNAAPSPTELYNSVYAFRQEMHVKSNGTSVTANLFTYRAAFDQYGYFDEQQLSLGDLLWGRTVYAKGCTIAYVPNVIVEHPARSFKELVIKEKRVGGGQGIRQRGTQSYHRHLLPVVKSFLPQKSDLSFLIKNGRPLPLVDRFKVLAIRRYLLHVRYCEQMRVALGKEPNRA